METSAEKPQPLPVSAKFSAAMARWVSVCMGERDIRHYLNGIFCQPAPDGGVFIVATDGHRMMVAFDKDGTANRSFIFKFNKSTISACEKNNPEYSCKRDTGRYIAVEGERLTVLDSFGGERYCQAGKCIIEGPYPKWEAVAPPRDRSLLVPGGDSHLNTRYLCSFDKQLPGAYAHSNIGHSVRLWRGQGDSSISTVYLEFYGLPLLGIIMPRRNDARPHFWLDAA